MSAIFAGLRKSITLRVMDSLNAVNNVGHFRWLEEIHHAERDGYGNTKRLLSRASSMSRRNDMHTIKPSNYRHLDAIPVFHYLTYLRALSGAAVRDRLFASELNYFWSLDDS